MSTSECVCDVIALLYLGHVSILLSTVLKDLHAASCCEPQYAVSCVNILDLHNNLVCICCCLFSVLYPCN